MSLQAEGKLEEAPSWQPWRDTDARPLERDFAVRLRSVLELTDPSWGLGHLVWNEGLAD